ncbi:MAG: hypothetical protein ACRD3J_07565, partial [Thermoanaerobaculia bacterium]
MKSVRLITVMVAGIAAMVPALAMAQTKAPAQLATTAEVRAIPDSTTPADTMKSVLTKKPVGAFYLTAPK